MTTLPTLPTLPTLFGTISALERRLALAGASLALGLLAAIAVTSQASVERGQRLRAEQARQVVDTGCQGRPSPGVRC